MKTYHALAVLALLGSSFVWSSAAFAADEIRIVSAVQEVESFVNDAGEEDERLIDTSSVVPGDLLRYTVTFSNTSDVTVDAGSIVITNPVPENTVYIDGTSFGSGSVATFSIDGGETFGAPEALLVDDGGVQRQAEGREYTHLRWVFEPALGPGEQSSVYFRVRLL